jgi:hypothetical protein
METADMAADVPVAVPEVHEAQREFYRGSRPQREKLSTEQQKAFDRAFAKREAKLRRQFEQMRTDLLETVGLCDQLLQRCADRLSAEDARAVRMGLNAIKIEHRLWENTCQKAQ